MVYVLLFLSFPFLSSRKPHPDFELACANPFPTFCLFWVQACEHFLVMTGIVIDFPLTAFLHIHAEISLSCK